MADTTLALKSISDLLSFFKTNSTLEGYSFDLDEEAILAQFYMIFQERNKNLKVDYHGLGPAFSKKLEDQIVLSYENRNNADDRLEKLQSRKKVLEELLAQNKKLREPIEGKIQVAKELLVVAKLKENSDEVKRLEIALKSKNGLYSKLRPLKAAGEALSTRLKSAENLISELQKTNELQTAFVAALDKFDEKSGQRLSERIMRASQVAEFFNDNTSKKYVVYFKPVSAGGTVRTVRGLLNSGSISYSGASIIAYTISSAETKGIVDGGLLRSVTLYQRINDGTRYLDEPVKREEGKPRNIKAEKLWSR